MNSNNEMLWVQIHIPYSKPALIGRCYRPPSSALCYLDELCTNIDRARDKGKGPRTARSLLLLVFVIFLRLLIRPQECLLERMVQRYPLA